MELMVYYIDDIRAQKGFREDSKEQYKFYLNLWVYSSCRVQDVM